jgi:Uma2 family endonuclease
MTVEEWGALDEDEPGELVDGVLVEEEMPDTAHEVIIPFLSEALRAWGRGANQSGLVVLGSGAKYRVAERRGRMPDLSVYLPGGPRPRRASVLHEPPSIAVEIVTATPRDVRRDRLEKHREYAAFGVRWYWIIDPAIRTFEVFELGSDGRYAQALGASEGTLTTIPGCEGLHLNLDATWSEADALPEGDRDGD